MSLVVFLIWAVKPISTKMYSVEGFVKSNDLIRGEMSRFAVVRICCDRLIRLFHLFENAIEKL